MQVRAFERYVPFRVMGNFIQVFTVCQSTPLEVSSKQGSLAKVICRQGHTRQTERAGDYFHTSALCKNET